MRGAREFTGLAGRFTVSAGDVDVTLAEPVDDGFALRRGRALIVVVVELSATSSGRVEVRWQFRRRPGGLLIRRGPGSLSMAVRDEPTSGGEGRWTLRLSSGDKVVVLAVEHPAGASSRELIERCESMRSPSHARAAPSTRARQGWLDRRLWLDGGGLDGGIAGGLESALGEVVGGGGGPSGLEDFALPRSRRIPMPDAQPPPERDEIQLAQVSARMPAEVSEEAMVDVTVTISQGEVRAAADEAYDSTVMAFDSAYPVTVTLLSRGFRSTTTAPGIADERRVDVTTLADGDAVLTFQVQATNQPGAAEVQIVVRQRERFPQPIATLLLTPMVVAGSPSPHSGLAAASTRISGATTALAPHSLVIDENLFGATSSLAFELVVPGFRCRGVREIAAKADLIEGLFRDLDQAWRRNDTLVDYAARSAAFMSDLRRIGRGLAEEVLPPRLLDYLREHLRDIDELTVITSGETDIPWEILYVLDLDEDDPEGRGFLGSAGLVRWVYNTRHPTELRVREGTAFYLIPRYQDPELQRDGAQGEARYLRRYAARALRGGTGEALDALLKTGEVDLLHFAGHGRADDTTTPPQREVLLAAYHDGASGGVYSLGQLQSVLRTSEPVTFEAPGPLIVVNACRVGDPPRAGSEIGGFAETFLRGGAGAFVGCLWSVADRPARHFVRTFYRELSRDATIAQATVRARRSARASGDHTWLAYTVYAHPQARVVGPSRAGRSAARTER